MAAILGLDLPAIEAACREAAQGQVVSPANINSPGPGRDRRPRRGGGARDRSCCKAAGAKRAMPLPVSAPFHCALMMPAQERLAARPGPARLPRPRPCPLVNNVDARGRARGRRVPRRPGAPGLGAGALAGVGGARWCARASTPSSRWGRARCSPAWSRRSTSGVRVLERRGPGVARGARAAALAGERDDGMSRSSGKVVAGDRRLARHRARHRAQALAAAGATWSLGARDEAKLAEVVARDRGRRRQGALRRRPRRAPTAPRWTPRFAARPGARTAASTTW